MLLMVAGTITGMIHMELLYKWIEVDTSVVADAMTILTLDGSC